MILILENTQSALSKIPNFVITGNLVSAVCEINKPVIGEITVVSCDSPIRSIELQLVRVETCGCAEGYAKECMIQILFSTLVIKYSLITL